MPTKLFAKAQQGKKFVPIKWRDSAWTARIAIRPLAWRRRSDSAGVWPASASLEIPELTDLVRYGSAIRSMAASTAISQCGGRDLRRSSKRERSRRRRRCRNSTQGAFNSSRPGIQRNLLFSLYQRSYFLPTSRLDNLL